MTAAPPSLTGEHIGRVSDRPRGEHVLDGGRVGEMRIRIVGPVEAALLHNPAKFSTVAVVRSTPGIRSMTLRRASTPPAQRP
jgi:hypothetical protein